MNPYILIMDYMNPIVSHHNKSFWVRKQERNASSILGFHLIIECVALHVDGNLVCAHPANCPKRKETCGVGRQCVDEEVLSIAVEDALDAI